MKGLSATEIIQLLSAPPGQGHFIKRRIRHEASNNELIAALEISPESGPPFAAGQDICRALSFFS